MNDSITNKKNIWFAGLSLFFVDCENCYYVNIQAHNTNLNK